MFPHATLLVIAAIVAGVDSESEPKAALVIIDVQICFLSGGSLAVSGGDDVIPVINRIRSEYGDRFSLVILSQDWHLPNHVSFAELHSGKAVGDVIQLEYSDNGTLCLGGSITPNHFPTALTCSGDVMTLNQMMWPVHCVQNVTSGPTSSNITSMLNTHNDDVIIQKGTHQEIDSYSAFYDNGRVAHTELHAILQASQITTLFVTGLALDYCVYYTALDSQYLGYDTYVVMDAARGVAPQTVEAALSQMTSQGVTLIRSADIGTVLDSLASSAPTLTRPVLGVGLLAAILAVTWSALAG